MTDKRKQSLYFPAEMLQEIKREANRQDRSMSWIVQRTWDVARAKVGSFPSMNDLPGGEDDPRGSQE